MWTFDGSHDHLAAWSGTATLAYFDPDSTGWGPAHTAFGRASRFGLPPMTGGEPSVMRVPPLTSRQGYVLSHNASPNGAFAGSHGIVSNYTLIVDLLYPSIDASSSGNVRRPLYQTETANANEAAFLVEDAPAGGLGIPGNFRGRIEADTWHRVAIVVQAAPEEGKAQRFIDGRFVGGIGTTNSGLGLPWTLDPSLLLFTDARGHAASLYVSSVYFVDRAMRMNEIEALGGPHAAGALTPGMPAPVVERTLPPHVETIGHRGGYFCCTPDNTMAAVRQAIEHGVRVIEIDTRVSADGHVVLMHDPMVDRTTNGSGPVASFTVDALQRLDAGSWFAPEFAGERVATLVEVMTAARGKLVLYFDLKSTGQIGPILAAAHKTGFSPADCWFWVSGDAAEAAAIRARLPEAKIVWTPPPPSWSSDPDYFAPLRAAGVYAFDMGVGDVDANPDFVRAAKAAGFVVAVHTVLDPEQMQRYADAGVDFIETDFPQVVHRLRR
jgi:glycerophosphoryl diester phosphodiesterase